MRIAIDITRAIIENAGIGRYSFEISQKMIDQGTEDHFLIYSTHFRDDEEKQKKFNSFKRKNVELKRLKIPGKVKEILWGLKLDFLKKFLDDSEVLFAPSFFEVGLGFKIPQVVAIHDMTHFLFPDQRGVRLSRYLSKRTLDVLKIAKKVICISNSTRKDVLKLSKVNPEIVEIIYPGRKIFSKIAGVLPNNLKKDSYILSVGTIEPRKNLTGLFEAYSRLGEKLQQQYPLVVAGGRGWNEGKIFEKLKELNLQNKVIFTGFVEDEILARLYTDCKIFIYPSLYEGFGLPVLEAMSFGAPTITSNISSMPEVIGDAGILVDPKNPEQISKAIEALISQDKIRNDLSKKALIKSLNFSWDFAAQETLDLIKSAK
ncbi:MAG: glycosyltransferase family 1 protein [Candidatus Berkelbacteria bacterium]|nr:glycosyltransferase family 1 protein [Candidatus Berkelbacteria bacterium]